MRLLSALLLFGLISNAAFARQATVSPDFCEQISKTVEHPEALADACRFVLSLKQHLPNVVCDQSTTRYVQQGMSYDDRQVRDELTAHVIYEDGRERYSDVKINGKPQDQNLSDLQGQYTKGEFGTDLVFAFSAESLPAYRFLRKASHDGHHVFVYESKILRENNHGWVLAANGERTYPEFVAQIAVDQQSHRIVRLEVSVTPEKTFPLSDVELSTHYENLPLGDGTRFVLPKASDSRSCLWGPSRRQRAFCSDNVLHFTNCHKFGAESRIVTDGLKVAPN